MFFQGQARGISDSLLQNQKSSISVAFLYKPCVPTVPQIFFQSHGFHVVVSSAESGTLFARLEPAKLITKFINKDNYRAEKKRPYQQKSLASPLGIVPIEPFAQLAASFMTSHALLVHIKLSDIHTN